MVATGYYIQSAIFSVAGLFTIIFGIIQLIAESLPWNLMRVTPMIRGYHIATVVIGTLVVALSIDLAGVYHVYPLAIILILKDSLSTLCLGCALWWLNAMLHVVFAESRDSCIMQPWLLVGVPTTLNICLAFTTTLASVHSGLEVYRGIWIAFLGVLLLCIAVANAICLVIYSNVISRAQPPNLENRCVLRSKLLVAFLGFSVIGGLQMIFAARVFVRNQTLSDAQVHNPEIFDPFWEGICFLLGISLVIHIAWIPLKEPRACSSMGSQQSREHLTSPRFGDRKHRNYKHGIDAAFGRQYLITSPHNHHQPFDSFKSPTSERSPLIPQRQLSS
eukprot:TRINITY_DN1781_c0_g1_i1.p1 TRINITY_DN1781_c0_g1~~TRINITY_DN1781_c0_g1_i1.p1  ORF type:complete len:333 (-),score=29.82 TRINITY_DN1781_c0_g1_i1:282-1280(-)